MARRDLHIDLHVAGAGLDQMVARDPTRLDARRRRFVRELKAQAPKAPMTVLLRDVRIEPSIEFVALNRIGSNSALNLLACVQPIAAHPLRNKH